MFQEGRQAGTSISSHALSEQAQKFNSELHTDNPGESMSSKGWLNHV